VVLVHHPREVPPALMDQVVRLGAPAPMAVARACVRAEGSPEMD